MRSLICSWLLVTAIPLLKSTRAQDPDPTTTVLPPIFFDEGRPANEEVVTIRNEYPTSNGFAIFPGILGDLEPTVFEVFFRYSDSGRTIITDRVLSRDAMAIALGRPHSPVEFVFTFHVVDTFTPIANIQVTIRVLDINNNAPVFIGYETTPLHLLIPVGSECSSKMAQIPPATDNDEGVNALLVYDLLDTFDGLFSLQTGTDNEGFINNIRLVLNMQLDTEIRDQYMLHIRAHDSSNQPLIAFLNVNITVDVAGDDCPVTQYLEKNLSTTAGTTNSLSFDPQPYSHWSRYPI